jgi:hypothetical protein
LGSPARWLLMRSRLIACSINFGSENHGRTACSLPATPWGWATRGMAQAEHLISTLLEGARDVQLTEACYQRGSPMRLCTMEQA